jgi:hypothetical protein
MVNGGGDQIEGIEHGVSGPGLLDEHSWVHMRDTKGKRACGTSDITAYPCVKGNLIYYKLLVSRHPKFVSACTGK